MFKDFFIFTAVYYLTFFLTIIVAALLVNWNDNYYLSHPNRKFARLIHRKPFKCNTCLSSWLMLFNVSTVTVLFREHGIQLVFPLIMTVFLATFFFQWREDKNTQI